MELLFGYGAGLLTLINPCVLPVLPVVMASAVQANRHAPLALAFGMSLTFVFLGVVVTAFGRAIGLYEGNVVQAGAVLMMAFGLILLVPHFSGVFATATSSMAASADARLDHVDQARLGGQVLGGMLLGVVWSPCIGPTLGGAIALASQGEDLAWAAAIMTSFAFGVSTLIIAMGYGARSFLQRHRGAMQQLATISRPVMGVAFLLVGAIILFRLNYLIEAWALAIMPEWLQDFSVIL